MRLLWMAVIVGLAIVAALWRYNMGPAIWIKRSCGRARAQDDPSSRQELVERVRKLLPQANDGNVVFSLQVESRTSGGGRTRVTTNTYYYKVFVADADCLWIVPFGYDTKTRDYQLGQPVALTRDIIQNVSLAGKRDKKLGVTFSLKPEVGLDKVVMVLEPLQVKLSKFYPFDLLQETACGRALALTEKLALSACGKSAEDLESGRLEDECTNYAVGAGLCGFCGVIAASVSKSLPLTLAFFAGALVCWGVMLAKKQFPKVSVVFVAVEAAAAWWLMGL